MRAGVAMPGMMGMGALPNMSELRNKLASRPQPGPGAAGGAPPSRPPPTNSAPVPGPGALKQTAAPAGAPVKMAGPPPGAGPIGPGMLKPSGPSADSVKRALAPAVPPSAAAPAP